jgi:hypothetical protein
VRLPALAADPIGERLEGPPPAPPRPGETVHDKTRRRLLQAPGQWLVLNTRSPLSQTTARRLARSYNRAKPARLDPTATGTFTARAFTRDDKWLVGATYQPPAHDAASHGHDQAPTGGSAAPTPPTSAPGPDH